jgi:hypothetical protein
VYLLHASIGGTPLKEKALHMATHLRITIFFLFWHPVDGSTSLRGGTALSSELYLGESVNPETVEYWKNY